MMDEGNTVDATYLDFDKAFDSVNHRFPLAKMKPFDLGDIIVRWIEAYLTGQFSRGHFRGELSGSIPLHSEFSQGSVTSQLLFLLLVNDLTDALEALTLLFADDAKMVNPRTQNTNLHNALIAAWDWSK